jgi:hypothetical protein
MMFLDVLLWIYYFSFSCIYRLHAFNASFFYYIVVCFFTLQISNFYREILYNYFDTLTFFRIL